jgi:lysophospholipase L1-like esterase
VANKPLSRKLKKPFSKRPGINGFSHGRFSKANFVVFALIFVGIGCYLIFRGHAQTPLTPTPMPFISEGLPAYSSGGLNGSTTSLLNNNNYTGGNTNYGYLENAPGWVAMNLSSVPAVQQGRLQKIYNIWSEEAGFIHWDWKVDGGALGSPVNYTIDGACQNLSSNTLPTTWTTLATVTGNTLHSRADVINMVDSTPGNPCNNNYNWLRLNATTASPGPPGWNGTALQLKWQIFDATQSMSDTWMFWGDSITANVNPETDWPGFVPADPTFAKSINAFNPNFYPAVENGGQSSAQAGTFIVNGTTVDGSGDSSPWIPKNHAHFVTLNLGTNDCNSQFAPGSFQSDMSTLVDDVMTDPANPSDPYTANRVVIIPTIPSSLPLRSGTNSALALQSNGTYAMTTVVGSGGGPKCNAVIAQVIAAKKTQYGANRVLAGPDLFNIMLDPATHWGSFAGDTLHPAWDAQGIGVWEQAWVNWAETNIYGTGSPTPTVSLTANPTSITSGQSSTLTWSSTSATSCSATTPSGWTSSTATSGTQSVSPTSTTTYTLSCTGAGGTAQATATVTVGSVSAPTATLAANPTTITSGSSSTLTWSSTNATSCSATAPSGFSITGTSGTQSVSPTTTTTYTISCTGAGGSVIASATVTVQTGPKVGDINGDNSVNITDLSLLLSSYSQNTTQCITNSAFKCDLSSPPDGVVNIFDLSILLSHYGT